MPRIRNFSDLKRCKLPEKGQHTIPVIVGVQHQVQFKLGICSLKMQQIYKSISKFKYSQNQQINNTDIKQFHILSCTPHNVLKYKTNDLALETTEASLMKK